MLQEIKPRITEIRELENGWDVGVVRKHESRLRSFQMLKYVKECLKRGDSQQTILDIMQECGY